MKLKKLTAENVHGYLPIRVDFFHDLTFLTGLNGTGKTSALRLLMALLTPRLDELGAISFTEVRLTVDDGTTPVEIEAVKTAESLSLRVSDLDHELRMSSSELEVYIQARRRGEHVSPVLAQYEQHPVILHIGRMATPMYLGLDRRLSAPSVDADDESVKRAYLRRSVSDDPSLRGTPTAALLEVNYLVLRKMQEVRASQEELDERLRNEFFAKAFVYSPADIFGSNVKLPSRNEVKRYRDQLTQIESAAEGVRIPVPQIQAAMSEFLERMTEVVESLERASSKPAKAGKKSKPEPPNQAHIEWIINKPQADRILQHLSLLHEYIENRNSLRDPINRFMGLINSFLEQTKKRMTVSSGGELAVSVPNSEEPRSIMALSSGERQLVVMLGHLSLNPILERSGVFIVDEPELSLHIDWQEKFVDAVQRANPNVQLVLATHSPAIILDRIENACDLTGTR